MLVPVIYLISEFLCFKINMKERLNSHSKAVFQYMIPGAKNIIPYTVYMFIKTRIIINSLSLFRIYQTDKKCARSLTENQCFGLSIKYTYIHYNITRRKGSCNILVKFIINVLGGKVDCLKIS